MQDYRQLEIFKEAMNFAEAAVKATTVFPDRERYGLISQISRSASSVYANIAEGCGRRTSKDFANFLYIAMGSLKETEAHFTFAVRLGYVDKGVVDDLLASADLLGRKLNVFIGRVSSGGN